MSLLVMFLVASSIAVAAMAIRGNPSALRVDSVARNGRANDVLQAQTEEAINGYMQTVKGVLSQYGGGLPPGAGGGQVVLQPLVAGTSLRPAGSPDTSVHLIFLSWMLCAFILGIIVAGVLWYLQQQQKGEPRKPTRRLTRPVVRKRVTMRDKVRSCYNVDKESTCGTSGSIGSPASSIVSGRGDRPGSPCRVKLPVTVVSPEEAIEAIDRRIQAAFTPYRNKESTRPTSEGSTVSASSASQASSISSVKRLHPIFMMKASSQAAEGDSNTTLAASTRL